MSKTIKWMIGNAVFGLMPLIIIGAIYMFSNGKICGDIIDKLITDGLILFVCIAVVGAVCVDIKLAGIDYTGISWFAVYGFPFLMPMLILLNFLLVKFKIVEEARLSASSIMTISTIFFSLLYILLAKTDLYMREDLKHATIKTQ